MRALSGLKLERALQRLRERGVPLVFSSEVVAPRMRVDSQPQSSAPESVLAELLAPHGLTTIEGAGGTLVVVAITPTSSIPTRSELGVIRGRVLSVTDLQPVGEAEVRVAELSSTTPEHVAETAPNGWFELHELAAGAWRVEVDAVGFVQLEQPEVLVHPGAVTDLQLEIQPAPYVHDEIVVRASELSVLQQRPAGPLSLSRREVRTLPHLGDDAFRALSFLPGITTNDNTARFGVRGGRDDEVRIVLDGQELYQAYHLRDFDDGISVVAADTLSGVRLTTGAFGAQHGDRMGGVLDLVTQHPSELNTRLAASLLNLQLTNGGRAGDDRASWLVSLRRGSIDLATKIFGEEDPLFWDAFAKTERDFGNRHRLRFSVLRASDALDFSETIDDEQKSFTTDYDDLHLWGGHQTFLGSAVSFETTAAWSSFDRDRRGLEDEEEQDFVVRDERDTKVIELRQGWNIRLSERHHLSLGGSGRRYRSSYDYDSRVEATALPASPYFEPRGPTQRFLGRVDADHLGLWLSERSSLGERLTTEIGLRFDRHALTDESLWSPRANLAWRLDADSVLRLGWGRFHQSQRSYELQVEDGETRFARAERSEHWVLGYERQFTPSARSHLGALRVELFHRSIDDPRDRFENLYEPINLFPEVEPDRVRLRPLEARSSGAELILRGALGNRTQWWTSYAYSTVEDRISDRWIRRRRDQPHALSLALSRELGRRWQLDIAWRYHTGWPTTPVSLIELAADPDVEGDEDDGDIEDGSDAPDETGPELALELGRLNSDRLSDYHRLDLRLSRSFDVRLGEIRFFLDVQNVYDRQNLAGFDLQIEEDERRLIRSEERWTGIFPSIGIAWEF